MKKYILLLMLVFLINGISAEVFLYNTINVNPTTSTTRQEGFYYLDDTSETGIASSKDTKITLWYEIEQLPFNFSGVYPVEVDYCNLTISHFKNIYGTNFIAFQGYSRGELLNTTLEQYSYSFSNSSLNSTKLSFNLRNKDYLYVVMSCHYTDPLYLYVENILVGRFTSYIGSYECNGCEKYSLEQITHEEDYNRNITNSELSIYTTVQNGIEMNWSLWLILDWVMKIVFFFLAVWLIFSGIFYYYKLLKELNETIRQ